MGLKSAYKLVHKQKYALKLILFTHISLTSITSLFRSAASVLRNLRITGQIPLVPANRPLSSSTADGNDSSQEYNDSPLQEEEGEDTYRHKTSDGSEERLKSLPGACLVYELEFYKVLLTMMFIL
jgi:hypothetical protein